MIHSLISKKGDGGIKKQPTNLQSNLVAHSWLKRTTPSAQPSIATFKWIKGEDCLSLKGEFRSPHLKVKRTG